MMSYYMHARNAYRRIMSYRQNAFFRLLTSLAILASQVLVWRALYAGRQEVAGTSLPQVLTYVVIVRLVGIAARVGDAEGIEQRFKSGDIGLDLLRPISTRLAFMSHALGAAWASVLLDGLPVLLLSVLLLRGIQLPGSWAMAGYFLLSTCCALVLNATLMMLFGTLAFWFLNVNFFTWVIAFFNNVFSGEMLPLWFMPAWMQAVALALPFQAARFTPVAIYLGRYSQGEIWRALAVQAGWIVGLVALQTVLWNRGIKRIVVHGG